MLGQPGAAEYPSEGDERNLVENFRVVRTNLLAMGTISKPAHVTMVTSAMPKEGKTVVSSNLAISFGQTGARTLLMDTDLRRGRLHRLFGLRKSPGLSDYLLGKVSLEEAIRPERQGESARSSPPASTSESGTELLGSPKFGELMNICDPITTGSSSIRRRCWAFRRLPCSKARWMACSS